ncbi:MAG: ABC transporter permease [Chitinophagaceae bacterium]|nr:ABC transporter permease [Chitinophagaceae bacterium]
MFRNYLKIAFRNISKYKFISFINLFGLSVGIACCLLILVYILNELSFDKYNHKPENIYRVTRLFKSPETGNISLHLGAVAPPFGPLLKHEFPEVQTITRLLQTGTIAQRYKEKVFNERDIYFADDKLFDIFRIKVSKGNARTALTAPYSVMITEDIAKKIFGSEDPLDKVIRLDNRSDFRVTGVFDPFPANAHLHPSMLLSFPTLNDPEMYGEQNLRTNWGNNSFYTYMRLVPQADARLMESRFPAFLDKVMNEAGSTDKPSRWTSLTLQRLTDIHLRSHLDSELEENGDINRVYIFSAIALFILLIACINYMNLSTARSALRAKEIGIRKVVGAERKEIIIQFLSESVLIAMIAMVFALLLTKLALPWLNNIPGQHLSFSGIAHPSFVAGLIAVPFCVGLLSGIYPALFMSSFVPSKVLKGIFTVGSSTVSFRKVLVTVQFAISIVLMISSVVVFLQLRYMQHKSLGFDKEHIITTAYPRSLKGRFDAFRTALVSDMAVKDVTRSSRIPSGRLLDAMGSEINRGDSLAPTNADIKDLTVDDRFISTYGIHVVAGRAFSRDFGTDSSSYVLNESAVKVLGLASNQDAVGKGFRYGGIQGKVIGVINDFHFESLMQKISPLVLRVPKEEDDYNRMSVKIGGNNLPDAISHMEKTWKQFLPDTPFDYQFMDDNIAKLYLAQDRQGTLFSIFTGIAIFIACLGLFGLSSFTITQRFKEIGIRKVLGASVSGIVSLLSKDFLRLVGIAAVIACPVAWYAMGKWLMDFAYRIQMSWWIFPAAAMLAAVIALATISVLTFKAATTNPVKSLRSE